MNYFDYLAQHPEADQVFNQAMSGYTTQLVGAVLDAYDFSAFKTIVDIGRVTKHCLLLFCGPIK